MVSAKPRLSWPLLWLGGHLTIHRRFALGMFSAEGLAFPGLVLEERVFDLAARLEGIGTVSDLIARWTASMPQLQELADGLGDDAGDHPLASLRALPPVTPNGQIFQAAANYRQHVLELMAGAEHRGDTTDGLTSEERDEAAAALDERARDGSPFVFLGSTHAMVGAEDDIVLPAGSEQHDWELELAVVIGGPGRRLSRADAMSVIAGYTICNDITTRDALFRPDARALGLDWLAGKNSPTFLPTGPLLVPAAHVENPMDLHLHLAVNGRTMQDEATADMLFDIADLIAHISNVAELRPGDLVLTGSPAGNGASHGTFLQPGDVIESSITGLGSQRNHCVAEAGDAASGHALADAGEARP
jgi:2-keto-4-pentenoate hydratase/2-oxohepta-3-ene-1,7-dioic acid hydratase in catechol pathway